MLMLHYKHNYSDAQIARMLGKTRGTVAVTMYRIRAPEEAAEGRTVMKSAERALRELVDRSIPTPSDREMESRCDRVLQNLQSVNLATPERTTFQPEPIHAWQRPWRVAVICAAVVAALVVALSPNIWKTPEGGSSSTTKTLADGSRIEMRAGAEAVVENVPDGLMIRLNSGSMMVFAAKQAAGRHLYVQTRDLKVSVVGTVFLVNADDKGSRVAVMEGEVRVQQGTVEKSLRPGEQLASNPKSENLQFFRETGWSREAYAYLSKLHESIAQSLAARQSPGRTPTVSDKAKFEEASIRPCEQDIPGVGGRGDSPGGGGSGSIRLSPGRVDALCLTVDTLIAIAHRSLNNNPAPFPGLNLRMNSTYTIAPHETDSIHEGTRVRGGPDWVRSEKYTIAAIGDSTDLPTLRGPMLLDLLERRFKLKLRNETEEIPVYAVTIATGGLKIKPIEIEPVKYEELRKIRASSNLAQSGPRPSGQSVQDPRELEKLRATYSGLLGCSFLPQAVQNDPVEVNRFREAVRRGVQPPECFGTPIPFHGPNSVIANGGIPISTLVTILRNASSPLGPGGRLSDTLNGLLVDKTNLPVTNCLTEIPPAGTSCAPLFNILMEYAIDDSFFTKLEKNGGITPADMGADLSLPKAPNVFNALEKLGLHLEKTKAPREFIVIDHIERPSPN